MRYAAWALMALVMLSGCSSLIIRDQDSAGTATGKVLTRILLCPLTLCLTEAGIAGRKFEEERDPHLYAASTARRSKNTDPEEMIRSMTSDENELNMLRSKQRAYPQHQTNEVFLSVMLDTFRTYKQGYQANLIKLRYEYPKATEQELAVLAHDATVRQMKQDLARQEVAGPPMGIAPQSIHCTSMNIGLFQSTDCY